MATLYEIDAAILECIDMETGELLDPERLTALQMERDEKLENAALWYKNLLSDAAQYKAEKEAFAAKEKAARAKADSLKEWLDKALAGNSFKTVRVSASYRRSEAVIIDDIYAINEDYLKYGEPTADKVGIKQAIKAGLTISGAHLEERNSLTIK